ncbi:hypothetical protein COJ27_09305 [Bacillus cereus]|uniref:Uncharacterized protein n=1 Tax=Bacillus cereus TaxID=1396 RepID=A0A9X6VLR2_BACCE|nr:hypothetical protein CN388_22055 [Bacillus cereus]PFC15165.1 hypothetical protein CN284_00615 [Bacillus cereus]PFD22738.1 hypothetical protein CN263_09500 [Bacillus cereus]PFL66593.1 hypothetical protein COJ27_09305 [Bacillus cereus]PGW61095.1 hypothetical protein COE18_18390 [Bacillus cereus]
MFKFAEKRSFLKRNIEGNKKRNEFRSFFTICLAICWEVRSPSRNSVKAKKLGGESTARKSPIGEG